MITFKWFLENRGLFAAFVRNASNYNGYQDKEPPAWPGLRADRPDLWVGSAFKWKSTPEGRTRWSYLHEEWLEVIYGLGTEEAVEPGFPLFDPLGLLLLASELEADDAG